MIPDDSSRQSMDETNVFDRLIDSVIYVESLSENENYYAIFGDFNSRTSTLPDYVENDSVNNFNIDLLPEGSDIELRRFSLE